MNRCARFVATVLTGAVPWIFGAYVASAPQQSPPARSSTESQTESAPYGQPPLEDRAEQQRITHYTLSPEREAKARAIAKVRLRMIVIDLIYGLIVLLLVLRWRLAAKYRDMAEGTSTRRFVQALIFVPLIVLTIDVLSLPTGIYSNHIERVYGLSVQGWGSWFWDWTKGEILALILSTLLVWILYGIMRKSRRLWWFWFWLICLPIFLVLFFLSPLVIDPMFHKFEPLQQKDPALTAALEKMVQRAGQDIPPQRMFWMGAGEKTTALNAYVTGFGASKRIVVWDTTIARMNTPQIVFVAGHEMGHYVLGHIPKGIAFFSVLFFVVFYIGYRLIGWMLAKWGEGWGIRELGDWASYPALLLLLSIIVAIVQPIASTYSRHTEHQADQYGLEVTHGLTPDSSQIAAQAFNILGDVNLSDPEPSRLRIFLFYDHPAIPDRIQFALDYRPWDHGEQPEFVK
jgi:STE24 endopeptidase